MCRRLFALTLSAIAMAMSGDAVAVTVNITDACGKTVSMMAGASTLVSSSGDLSINQVSGARYTAGVAQCDAVAAGDLPKCTLSASATKVATGSPVTLFAKCSASPGNFMWAPPSGGPALPSNAGTANAIDLTFTNPGSYTYAVAGMNGSGTGPLSTQVTILVSAANSKPACVLTASPAIIQYPQKTTLQVSCNPAATSAIWSVDTLAIQPPASNAFSSELAIPFVGVFTYKVQGVNTAGVGPVASATVTVEASAPTCVDGPVDVLRDFSLSASYADGGPGGKVVAYKFVYSPQPSGPVAEFDIARKNQNTYLPMYASATISRCKGDFSMSMTDACSAWTEGEEGLLISGSNTGGLCPLQAGVAYYLNYRVESCMFNTCWWVMQQSYAPTACLPPSC